MTAIVASSVAGALMASLVVSIPAGLPVVLATGDYFARYGYTAFPVTDTAGTVLGLVTIDRVQALSPDRRAVTRVAEIVDRDRALIVPEDLDVAELLERPRSRASAAPSSSTSAARRRGSSRSQTFSARSAALS